MIKPSLINSVNIPKKLIQDLITNTKNFYMLPPVKFNKNQFHSNKNSSRIINKEKIELLDMGMMGYLEVLGKLKAFFLSIK